MCDLNFSLFYCSGMCSVTTEEMWKWGEMWVWDRRENVWDPSAFRLQVLLSIYIYIYTNVDASVFCVCIDVCACTDTHIHL